MQAAADEGIPVVGYDRLIDAETWAYIERVNAFYPADAIDRPLERQREINDALCRAFHAGYPGGVTTEDFAIPASGRSIQARRYALRG